MKCLNCDKDLPKRKRKSAKYCNAQCMADYTKKKIIEEWEINPDFGTVKSGLSDTIRNYLLEKAGLRCEECTFEGYNISTGKTILEIDHVDGNCYNNHSSNLRVVCPNCHAMGPNYRALNKGSGRKYRKIPT